MADTYVVTAPYVVLKVKDTNGAWVVQGYYKDAPLLKANVDPESLKHHVDNGLVEAVEQPKPEPKPASSAGSKASTKSS